MNKCSNRIDADDDESAPCGDEGRMCEACGQEYEREMALALFGTTNPDSIRRQVRARIDAATREAEWIADGSPK